MTIKAYLFNSRHKKLILFKAFLFDKKSKFYNH